MLKRKICKLKNVRLKEFQQLNWNFRVLFRTRLQRQLLANSHLAWKPFHRPFELQKANRLWSEMQVWMRVSACRQLDSGNFRSFSMWMCVKSGQSTMKILFFANEARMHVYIKILALVTAVAFLWHVSNDADVSRNSLMSTWLERRKRCLGNDAESRFLILSVFLSVPSLFYRGGETGRSYYYLTFCFVGSFYSPRSINIGTTSDISNGSSAICRKMMKVSFVNYFSTSNFCFLIIILFLIIFVYNLSVNVYLSHLISTI